MSLMAETTDKAPKKSFFKGLKSEFGKIKWTSKQDLVKQTVLVIVITLVLGVLITGIDSVVLEGLNLLLK